MLRKQKIKGKPKYINRPKDLRQPLKQQSLYQNQKQERLYTGISACVAPQENYQGLEKKLYVA
ncbi:hypothetical protein ACFLZB_03130 [Nanoarchaeota archaeon]